MTIPNILALDFDGVLCDGVREYFETSRRTYMKVWPGEKAPDQGPFRYLSGTTTRDHDGLGDACAVARHHPGIS